jgi:iron complex outermembrane receptor protein
MSFQKPLLIVFFFSFYCAGIAQQKDTEALHEDTIVTAFSLANHELDSVTVTAFSLQSRWQDAPAAVAVVTPKQLQLINNVSLVPGLNIVPGVRMEERSPGSYRLSIRGSLLRSPFGVRNVKVYWNDIPLTDAGGNTYLQLVDINQVQSVEVIKGPASSMYGANTGGALLLHSGSYTLPKANSYHIALSGGSFGLFNEQAGWEHESANLSTSIQQSHVSSNGYRQQSSMRRDALKWDGTWSINPKEKLSFLASYTDLFYETPGGITLQQMQTDPTLARQPTAIFPGAVEQKASVRNKTAFAGASLTSTFNLHVDNTTTLTANHTDFTNPFITNYEQRNEWNYGGRTTFRYHNNNTHYNLQWLIGGEWQQNHSHIDDYGNNKGVKDTVQFKDELYATQYFVFTQLNFSVLNKLVVQAGVSSNKQIYSFRRLTDPLYSKFQNTNEKNLFTPRLSLLYKPGYTVSFYAIAARGFSPPTLAEIRPSDNQYYPNLQAEYGWNYEGGLKGGVWNDRFLFDASYYYFHLQNAIVRRLNATGAEYFVNAGSATMKGVEVWLKAYPIKSPHHFISSLAISNSFSYQPYYFDQYSSDTANYSGNRLTGVPQTLNVSTAELQTKLGWYANIVYNYTSSIPLNDANDAYATAYHLLQAKLGYMLKSKAVQYNFFVGSDNLLNETYSLGNDINALGKRYYNPAPKRNYFAGIQVSF